MGQEIQQTAFAHDDFSLFQEQLAKETAALEKMFDAHAFANACCMCGIELEAWLVDQDYNPSASNGPFIERLASSLVVPELSQFNFELNTTPFHLDKKGMALLHLHDELQHTWQQCEAQAEQMGGHAMLIGVMPTLRDQMLTKDIMTVSNRYRALNRQLFAMRGNTPLSFHIDEGESLHVEQADIMLEAASTSLQVHFQVAQDDTARTYNASIIASAACVAVAANAPYLYGRALWEETRIAIFEHAVPNGNLRNAAGEAISRVSLGNGYVAESLFEIFAGNLQDYPVILPVRLNDNPETLPHLRLHNGTIWRWNRPLVDFDIQTGKAGLRIEHRTMSAGPTVADTIANTAFYLGLTHALASQSKVPEKHLPFMAARDNFYAAAKYGLAANVWWMDGEIHNLQQLCCRTLLPLAREGLQKLGIRDADISRYIDDVLEPRVQKGKTGAAWQKNYIAKYGPYFEAMTAAYARNQKRGLPVHEWEET